MGTRGFVGFVVDDNIKISYNHFDSYPDGIGTEVLKDVKEIAGDPRTYANKARSLTMVEDKDDNYSRLRDLQGRLLDTLKQGEMVDASDFPVDSLFCEWGYLVDFGQQTFEVYKGWQKTPPTSGRWVGRPTQEEQDERAEWARNAHKEGKITDGQLDWYLKAPEYFAVALVASWGFRGLPSEDEFLAALIKEDD